MHRVALGGLRILGYWCYGIRMNTSLDSFITTYGWVGLGVTVLGLILSSFGLAYYTGYRKGGGEWRRKDLFAPRPLVPHPDAELVDELRRKETEISNLRSEISRIQKLQLSEHKRLTTQIEKLRSEIPAPKKPATSTTRRTATKKQTA